MVTLIDASVLIAVERGTLEPDQWLALDDGSDYALAAITASELLHGVHRGRTAAQRTRREAFVEHLLARLPVLPFDLAAARLHSRIRADLAARGVAIGAHDLLIAASAMATGSRVLTRDQRSFPLIPGLPVTAC